MFRIIALISLLAVSISWGRSQEYSREWGEISQAELELEAYDKDPEAEALVLYDIGETAFFWKNDTYYIRFTQRKRIKILKEAGLSWVDVSLPYYSQSSSLKERIHSIEGQTFNLTDGTLVKTPLDTLHIYHEQISERLSVQKFALPKVKKGSIIEYRYVLESPFKFNLPEWRFQDRIPTVFSKYSVKFIPIYAYAFISQGIEKFDYEGIRKDSTKRFIGQTSFSDHIKTYEMHEVPAFKDEAFISTLNDYVMKINFQLSAVNYIGGGLQETVSTWPQFIKTLNSQERFGRYVAKARSSSKVFFKEKLNIEAANAGQRAKAIIELMKNTSSWNGENGKFTTQSVKSFEISKRGNVADINLYLTGMLQAAGIKASPIILSTRDHGRIKANYPFERFFNYVVVLIELGDKFYLADASAKFLGYNRIPPRAINHKGLIVNKRKVNWVDMEMKIPAQDKKILQFEIDPESLHVHTSLTIQSRELKAYYYRKNFENEQDKLTEFFEELGFSSCREIETMNYEKVNAPYIIQVSGEADLGIYGDKLVVSPLLGFPISKNELVQKERTYPVDFISSSQEEFSSICNIPQGFKFLSGPENFSLEDDLVKIELELTHYDDALELTGTYSFKKAIYAPHEYVKLKEHIDTIIKIFNQEIVMKKV